MKPEGVVKSLWRYPVKSMLGEPRRGLVVEGRGVAGDRLYALADARGKLGSGKNTQRFVKIDGLLGFRAAYDGGDAGGGGVPVITFPDGRAMRGDDSSIHSELSAALGLAVTLAQEQSTPHFDAAPIHLVTTSSLAWLKSKLPGSVVDERRFRPNVVVKTEGSGPVEQGWVGRRIRLGRGVTLEVLRATIRCVMTNFAQPGVPEDKRPGIPEDKSVFAYLGREADLQFGVYARVVEGGEVGCGDAVEIL